MTPVEPPKQAIGTKTADNTSAMPTKAPVIWFIDFMVASLGESPSSAIRRSTFSTTTMASSTKSPMARTIPNMVSVLIEKPVSESTAKVPSRITGTAMVGISVARMFCRKRYITRKTKTIASINVLTTSSIEILTNGVVSYGYSAMTPGGKVGFSLSIVALTASAVLSAFAPVASLTAIAEAGLPLYLVSVE